MEKEVMDTERENAINSYVTDMLALESHIEKALRGQVADFADDAPVLSTELRTIHATCERHVRRLEALADSRGSTGTGVAEAVKKAAASMLGLGAAAVDFIRTEKIPKDLRDDYAAVSLACIGYVMLYTTATALDDSEVAKVAYEHLQDHAKSTMTLHNIVPGAVLHFLRSEGLTVRDDVLSDIGAKIQQVWKSEDGVTQTADAAHA